MILSAKKSFHDESNSTEEDYNSFTRIEYKYWFYINWIHLGKKVFLIHFLERFVRIP